MGYILGQIVPHKPRQIIAEGDPRWHCLFTRQQSESAAVKRLAALGIEAFYPVTERQVTNRGKTRVIQSRYLPGYVFARFPGDPVWHELWPACTFITDVLRLRSGHPGIIRQSDLTNIMAMRATDQEQDRARKARSLIRRGDRVRLACLMMPGEPLRKRRTSVMNVQAGQSSCQTGSPGKRAKT